MLEINLDENNQIVENNKSTKKIQSMIDITNLEADKAYVKWLDNPNGINEIYYETKGDYRYLETDLHNVAYILGRYPQTKERLYVKQGDNTATITIENSSDDKLKGYWSNYNEVGLNGKKVSEWERFLQSDDIIITNSYPENQQTDFYCIGINKDNPKKAFCSDIGPSNSENWNYDWNHNNEYTNKDTRLDNAAHYCFTRPYGPSMVLNSNTGNILSNGETGIIFGEGNCQNYVGQSLYNLPDSSERRYYSDNQIKKKNKLNNEDIQKITSTINTNTIIDKCNFRVGNEKYKKLYNSF